MRRVAVLGVVCLCVAFGQAGATTVGPAGGYVATDAVPFAFEDISGTGTQVLADIDDATALAAIGFTFNLFGAPQTQAFISSNGNLTFGLGNSSFTNPNLAAASLNPDVPTIAVLWDDYVTFDSTGADAVYYQTLGAPGSRRFVVEWHDVQPFAGSANTNLTFEATLFEGSGIILLQYADVVSGVLGHDNGASATVGIRDLGAPGNGRVLQWSFNQGVITDGQAIEFSPTGASTAPVPEPGTMALLALGALALVRRCRRKF